MVEMTVTARILNTATPQSLVILDEIGRGTSTYDGLSLAWSIVEHIHNEIGCRTLFATHYHELTDLADELAGVRNCNVAVKEWDDQVVFLHQIVPGAADKSYGIHVAQLAGVPRAVSDRAREVMKNLEAQHHSAEADACGLAKPQAPVSFNENNGSVRPANHWQLTLFGFEDHPLLEEIRETDLDTLDADEALTLVRDWQRRLTSGLIPAKQR
jgi:DNA mismatch repair protein MutS